LVSVVSDTEYAKAMFVFVADEKEPIPPKKEMQTR